jgi:VWFA-related protein
MQSRLRLHRAVALLLALLVWRPAGQAQQQPATQKPPQPLEQTAGSPQQPTFRAGVNFVRVDIIVTDKNGEPVSDLQPADFEVVEDGKPQKIETFKLVHVTGEPAPGDPQPRETLSTYEQETEAARDDVRLYVIFLDDYHVRRGAGMSVRDPLINFINTQLAPNDLAAVVYPLTPMSDLRFTRSRDALVSAIQNFDGRKYDYQPRNDFEERYANYPASTVERIRNEVTFSALKALVTHLGSVREGRKAVILVSEGFTNMLPPQLRDPVASMPGFGNPARGQPSAGENDPTEDSATFFASVDLQEEMRNVYDAANRNNTAIYTVDPRGLAVFEFDINEGVGTQADSAMLQAMTDTLRVLASETDGRAVVSQNDLAGGLRQIVRDSSEYYLIGYSSTENRTDGKFHDIAVRVKRPGVQVRSRKGYWALTAEDAARAAAPPKPGPPPAVTRALTSILEPPRGRPIRTWIGTARGEDGKTRVTFVWEPIPAPPGTSGPEPVRVSLVAAGASGRPFFRGRVPEAGPASGAPSGANTAPTGSPVPEAVGGPSRVVFDADPGKMELRIAAEGANAQVLDSDVRAVDVPDLTAAQVALSTPRVFRARTARDFRLFSASPDAVPTATREFSRNDRLLIRFDAYGPGGTAPTTSARLLNRAGQPMVTLSVEPGTAEAPGPFVDLPLGSLASGEYLVEIRASGEGGDAAELIPIRVVS